MKIQQKNKIYRENIYNYLNNNKVYIKKENQF